jgi:hypothetical protein
LGDSLKCTLKKQIGRNFDISGRAGGERFGGISREHGVKSVIALLAAERG